MNNLVEAIEEGQIVKVPEEYARKEGLLILRKSEQGSFMDNQDLRGIEMSAQSAKESMEKKAEIELRRQKKGVLKFDELRKPLKWRENQIIQELIENFHWHISKARKARGMNRKQLAQAINISENNLKLIENGIIPEKDFVMINKIQDFLQINLRKDGKDFNQRARMKIESEKKIQEELKKKDEEGTIGDEMVDEVEDIIGEDIEIIE